jgi:hypothetical protein
MLKSISTIVTVNLIKEFYILEYSMRLFNPTTKIVVLCDNESGSIIRKEYPNIIVFDELEFDINNIKHRGNQWLEFMIKKSDVIEKAINLFGETLFVDSDIVFLNTFNKEIISDACLSQHFILLSDEAKYGTYNGGYFFIKNLDFCDWFKKTTYEKSKFYEQFTLNFVNEKFDTEYFDMNHNFGWWRLYQTDEYETRYKKFGYGNNIYYDKTPLISVHAHFYSDGYKDSVNDKFCDLILTLLKNSKKEEHKKLVEYIYDIRK